MLANNIVRINGYKNNKRTHVDIVVSMTKLAFNGIEIEVPRVPNFDDIPWIGFENGLEAVTSYNAYNWVCKERITSKV